MFAAGFGVWTFKSTFFRSANYTISFLQNRVQFRQRTLPVVLAMQIASQQNAIETDNWLTDSREGEH